MPIPKKIINFLEKNKVKYQTIEHRTVYTAFDKAKTLRLPEKNIGKTLLMTVDKSLALVLIPANKNLDKNKLKKISKAKKIDFATEKLIKNKIKGVKVGAVPPFGSLWKLPTFLDKSLIKEPKVILNGGNYNFSIQIKTKDLIKLMPESISGSFTKSKK